MRRLLLLSALLLAQCGSDAPLAEVRGVDETGVVTAVADDHAHVTIDIDGTLRDYELREETPMVDASGARRTAESLDPGSTVQIRATVSPSGRRTAERVTILAGPDAGLPSIIEPPLD